MALDNEPALPSGRVDIEQQPIDAAVGSCSLDQSGLA
jgi:hypothetical protein